MSDTSTSADGVQAPPGFKAPRKRVALVPSSSSASIAKMLKSAPNDDGPSPSAGAKSSEVKTVKTPKTDEAQQSVENNEDFSDLFSIDSNDPMYKALASVLDGHAAPVTPPQADTSKHDEATATAPEKGDICRPDSATTSTASASAPTAATAAETSVQTPAETSATESATSAPAAAAAAGTSTAAAAARTSTQTPANVELAETTPTATATESGQQTTAAASASAEQAETTAEAAKESDEPAEATEAKAYESKADEPSANAPNEQQTTANATAANSNNELAVAVAATERLPGVSATNTTSTAAGTPETSAIPANNRHASAATVKVKQEPCEPRPAPLRPAGQLGAKEGSSSFVEATHRENKRLVNNIIEGLAWHDDALDFLAADEQFGEEALKNMVDRAQGDSMSTSFSGIECPHTAACCNIMALRRRYNLTEKDLPMPRLAHD